MTELRPNVFVITALLQMWVFREDPAQVYKESKREGGKEKTSDHITKRNQSPACKIHLKQRDLKGWQ